MPRRNGRGRTPTLCGNQLVGRRGGRSRSGRRGIERAARAEGVVKDRGRACKHTRAHQQHGTGKEKSFADTEQPQKTRRPWKLNTFLHRGKKGNDRSTSKHFKKRIKKFHGNGK